MKPKSNYSRPMAAIYIIISFLATLIVLELICFLTFYPLLENRFLRIFASLIWLYAGAFAYYKILSSTYKCNFLGADNKQ